MARKKVVKKQKKEVAVQEEDMNLAILEDQGNDEGGTGFEEADIDSYAIPFINILQSNSPQCKKSDGAYVEGAEEGMFFNTATEEVYEGETGLSIIPCHYRRVYIEWLPDRGGFVAEHSLEDGAELLKQCTRNDKNKDELPNGNLLSDTRVHYCILLTADGAAPVVMSLTSTQIKKSKKWMSLMKQQLVTREDGSTFCPKMFATIYHAATTPESNDHGSWMGWKFNKQMRVKDPAHYQAAKDFRSSITKGTAKVIHQEVDITPDSDNAVDNDDSDWED